MTDDLMEADPIRTEWDPRTRIDARATAGPLGMVAVYIGEEEPPTTTFAWMSPEQADGLVGRIATATAVARRGRPSTATRADLDRERDVDARSDALPSIEVATFGIGVVRLAFGDRCVAMLTALDGVVLTPTGARSVAATLYRMAADSERGA